MRLNLLMGATLAVACALALWKLRRWVRSGDKAMAHAFSSPLDLFAVVGADAARTLTHEDIIERESLRRARPTRVRFLPSPGLAARSKSGCYRTESPAGRHEQHSPMTVGGVFAFGLIQAALRPHRLRSSSVAGATWRSRSFRSGPRGTDRARKTTSPRIGVPLLLAERGEVAAHHARLERCSPTSASFNAPRGSAGSQTPDSDSRL
jgi:hypothetical protein